MERGGLGGRDDPVHEMSPEIWEPSPICLYTTKNLRKVFSDFCGKKRFCETTINTASTTSRTIDDSAFVPAGAEYNNNKLQVC